MKVHRWKPGTDRTYCGRPTEGVELAANNRDITCRACVQGWDRHERQPLLKRWNRRR